MLIIHTIGGGSIGNFVHSYIFGRFVKESASKICLSVVCRGDLIGQHGKEHFVH